MTDTANLALPFIEAAQAQKHVTHNEALRILDALVMLAVKDRDLSSPPATPAEGERYIVKSAGSGAFAGKDNQIAHYNDAGWSFYPPHAGWTCYVEDESTLLAFDGAAWAPAVDVLGGVSELQELARLGVGTTADATNPFAAKLNNALWVARTVAEGGDGNLRYKLSKEAAAKTLSLLFQTNYSGRAEIGLTGDDDFHVKVSADGSSWLSAIVIDHTSGVVSMPQTPLPTPSQIGAETLGKTATSNVQTASYTLALSDAGKPVRMNVGSANNLTVPPNSSVAFPTETYINIEQYGAGQTTIVPGSGVTVRSRNGLKMAGQYAMATLHKIGTDEWMLGGDVTT
jgi:hypothetical protein